ncbi:MAG: Sec-independent protein translocase protein TatA [Alphaproteobacteria bacterium MarineAlpha2_Bin1]|nr:MAG: Sec-independent protein translocase protein TatA [Alphaproteobacteria bacterium MarineAlpha2_Bin1]|tara:strand:- start:205 stop:435 length:231 start_codon:yes stop_codon:yes gene_type:complete
MGISFWQIGVVLVLVLLLFGRGRISHMMGDLAKGIKSFKKGMNENDTSTDNTTKTIDASAEEKSESVSKDKETASS